jgi:hypothetical protein
MTDIGCLKKTLNPIPTFLRPGGLALQVDILSRLEARFAVFFDGKY